MARRRREFSLISKFPLAPLIFSSLVMNFLSDIDSPFRIIKEYSSLPAAVCSPSSTVSSLSEPSQTPPGSDQFSGQPRSPPLPRTVSKKSKPRSEEASSLESEITCNSTSRVLEELASVNFNASKLHRRKTMDGGFQTHLVFSTVGYPAMIHNLHRPAIPCWSPPRRQNHLTAVLGEEKLGFPSVGLSNFGPCSFLLWPISSGDIPFSSHRPRSVKISNLTNPLVYLRLNISLTSRGLFSRIVLVWIQGLVELFRMGGRLCISVFPLETVSDLEYKFEASYIVELRAKHIYQTLVLSKSSSSPLSSSDLSNPLLERGSLLKQEGLSYTYFRKSQLPFPPSPEERTLRSFPLSVRGEFLPVVKPENLFNAVTALFSSVMAHSVPVETTVTISLRTEVRAYPKSYGKLTMLKLVDEFVLKSGSCTYVLEMFNSSPNIVSNLLKFVSLPKVYVCCYVSAVWLLYWLCPSKLLHYVPF